MRLLALALGTLISEDLACITAGLLIARGELAYLPATAACASGIFAGDLLLFVFGRFAGAASMPWLERRWREPIRKGSEWFARHGLPIVFVSRFIPGMRLPAYVAAGALRTDWKRFTLYFALAVLIWTPLLTWSASAAPPPLLIAALALLAITTTNRRRRLLVARWKRLTHWEYWPAQITYLPLIPYLLWLAVKHRGLTFTAVNPLIPAGGFVGESKYAILRALHAGFLPRTCLVRSAQQALENIRAFPVVLKPDVGQRGAGVVVARSMSDVVRYFADEPRAVILQEHVDGPEFGIFYVRYPNEARGRIISVTEKRLPAVFGDGRSTIEELILRDDRAVCMARRYFERFADRLRDVPAAGEEIVLGELGTHCRGALFLDGSWVLTPELEQAIDDVSQNTAGFHFGRYDVRATSIDELRAGRFKVLELNGVTSEPTHIYDPGVSVIAAYRALFAQWRMAFEIGAMNRRRGATTTSVAQLVRLVVEHT